MFKGIKDIRELAKLQRDLQYEFKVSILPEPQFNEANLLQKLEILQSEGYHILTIFERQNNDVWLIFRKSRLKGV